MLRMTALRPEVTRWSSIGIVSGIVAAPAVSLADHYDAPVMLSALLLGMAVNFMSQEARCAGIDFTARRLPRHGHVLTEHLDR